MKIPPKSLHAIEKILNQAVDENDPGIAIGIAQGGRTVWGGARGLANLAERTPFTTKTPFRICSISKQFACALAMCEARAGRLKLDAHPGEYLPWARVFDRTLTVGHLMQNKSGIRDQWVMAMMMGATATQPFTLEDGNEVLRRAPESMFAPGSREQYCNGNFELVGQILETITGRPFAELLAANILAPLGMRDTFLGVDTSLPLPGDTRGYRFHNEAWEEEENRIYWAASAGMVSTIEDLLRWAACLRNPKAAGLPFVADIVHAAPFNDGALSSYAAGINHFQANGRAMLTHGGALRGWKSVLTHFVAEDTSIAVFMNRNQSPQGRMPRTIAREVAEALGILPVWRAHGKPPRPASLPKGAAGAWVAPGQGRLVLLREGEKGAEAYQFLDWLKLYRTDDKHTLVSEDGHLRLTFREGGATLADTHENLHTPLHRAGPEAKFAARGVYRSAMLEGTADIAHGKHGPTIAFKGIFGEGVRQALTVLDAHTAYFDIPRGVDEAPPGRVLVAHDARENRIELSATLARRIVFKR